MPVLRGGTVDANSLKMADVADAMLYVGSRDALTVVSVPPEELNDTTYGKEVNRRVMIQIGQTIEFNAAAEEPQYPKPGIAGDVVG